MLKKQKEYYERNKDWILDKQRQYSKQRYLENRESILQRTKKANAKRRLLNPELVRDKQRQWRAKNKERCRGYYYNNKPKIREQATRSWIKRSANNPKLRLIKNLRNRLRKAVERYKTIKSKSTMDLIGCTALELRKHIEGKFKTGMSWDNYGQWHIDHIIPIAAFDIRCPFQQKEAFNYKNLQPLWGLDNISKGDKLTKSFQPSFSFI